MYTASSRALAVLELLVHTDPDLMPPAMVLVEAEVPDDVIEAADPLPAGWDSVPSRDVSRDVGTLWAREGRSVALAVPSVVVPLDHNVLLNPLHPDFGVVQVQPQKAFEFDPRLFSMA